ncbi:PREDICTED: probable disease resistance protein At1g12280 isoform X2 [Camelina sativa]|uniref:Probable disease resistance protein At1g12280 isoform X2 n=1 Tax=Camelina sativa TaxID=90675 RepID=A0ABM1R8C1_CAMSA|nr:PREDICTED: probable disease resistance protein At1g12280 isoform X2 [Camelina sativa]
MGRWSLPRKERFSREKRKVMGVLKAKRDDVQGRVDREEFTARRRRLSQIQVWLVSVRAIENQVNDLFSTSDVELQRLCLFGYCSKNVKISYVYGKSVVLMLREIESLISQGEFDTVTAATSIAEIQEVPIQPPIVGQETMLERVCNRLMEDGVNVVGLYGMGGVGKTTLLTQINNKLPEKCSGFGIVIWVGVSRTAEIHRIQGEIGKRLGFVAEEWDNKHEDQRALDIHKVLRRQKFVLLLDDIWEKVDLKALGVPYPNRQNGCKVVLATRSRDVCGRMGDDDPMEVSCLDPHEAWELFQMRVGKNTLKCHPDIPELARKVAGKCRGLPLALSVIGETMACKRMVQEWRNAVDVLSSYAAEFSGMEDQVLPVLKYSYDNINKEHVQSCFLYCSLFPEDYRMEKERLIDYWICEGFIDENESRERELRQGYEIIGILVRACLLLEEAINKEQVKMHDVVREMALWIASDLGEHKEQCIVQAGVGLREVPKVKNWSSVRKMSLMENEIETISGSPECPELTTLFLQKNDSLLYISDEFFRCMPMLVVLDLSGNSRLRELPEEISKLVSLRYLDLSWTYMKRLPVGLQELKKLRYLRLDYMKRLKSISGISSLSSLRKLQLLQSKMSLDMSLVEELQLLEHLEVVNTSIKSSLVGEKLVNAPRLVQCLQIVVLRGLQEESSGVLTLPAMDNLRKVILRKCGMWEIKIERTTLSWNRSPTARCFSNLSTVHISSCNGLKDLTWLLFAPNLTSLEVLDSGLVEGIISQEKAMTMSFTIPFQKLESLRLHNLAMLRNIYWEPLPFPCLKTIHVTQCPELRKLPLDSKSVMRVEELVIKYQEEEWYERVEWDDEGTRLRFLPSFKFFGPEWQVMYVR